MTQNVTLKWLNFVNSLLIAVMALFASNLAFAEAGIPSAQQNVEFRNEAVKHLQEALAAKGDKKAMVRHIFKARKSAKKINSEFNRTRLQRATYPVMQAGLLVYNDGAYNGDAETAAALVEKAIRYFTDIQF